MISERSPFDRRVGEDRRDEFDDLDDLEIIEPAAAKPLEDDPDFAELQADLEAAQVAPLAVAGDDAFDELENLLAEVKASAAETKAVKDARARAKSRYGNTPEDLARIKAWELAREWKSVANCALFKRFECVCGFHATVFSGLLLEQTHRYLRLSNRWTAQDAAIADLPNKTAIAKVKVPVCQRCAISKGWGLNTELEWNLNA